MTAPVHEVGLADDICDGLIDHGLGPFLGTPCGILSPLYQALQERARLLTVPREDSAVGIAAGCALVGRCPVVLMQNSGLGQSVNALASLVVPYRLPMLLVVSMRGVGVDVTVENQAMGRLTEPLLAGLGIDTWTLDPATRPGGQLATVAQVIRVRRSPVALLVPPDAFGWRP
jgi:sulfopyruvate decarboxylase subunit alpha